VNWIVKQRKIKKFQKSVYNLRKLVYNIEKTRKMSKTTKENQKRKEVRKIHENIDVNMGIPTKSSRRNFKGCI